MFDQRSLSVVTGRRTSVFVGVAVVKPACIFGERVPDCKSVGRHSLVIAKEVHSNGVMKTTTIGTLCFDTPGLPAALR